MSFLRFIAAAAAAAVVAACASAPRAFPIIGATTSLGGIWQGDFTSTHTGRTGIIHFELKAGQDSAYGDVLMVAERWDRGALRPTEYPAPPVETPELLGVRFVQVSEGRVRGTLTPYRDPACDCTVRTIFEGVVKSDRIEGTYQTFYSTDAATVTGKWKVKRVSAELDPCIDSDDPAVEREDWVQVQLRDFR